MSSALIHSLLLPPDSSLSQRAALNLLDSQLSSWQAVSLLPDATRASQSQRDSLQLELSSSRTEIDALISQTRSLAGAYRTQASDLSQECDSLVSDLSSLSEQLLSTNVHGDSQPTLLEDLETLHRSLDELRNIKEYVVIIEKTMRLSEAAVAQIRDLNPSATITPSALTQYKLLQEHVAQITEACTSIDDSAQHTLHLVVFVKSVLDRTWAGIRNTLSETLLTASEKLRWPMPVDYAAVDATDRAKFEKAFIDLVNLQIHGDNLRKLIDAEEHPYPLQALVRPLSQRFKFHFEGKRETNKLDKPEWYFTHVLNVSHEHRPFMSSVIQQLFFTTKYKSVDAWQEFTALLLAFPARKLRSTIPAILPYPPLLAHTIYQALSFDAALREDGFSYELTLVYDASRKHDTGQTEGISSIILGKKEWFDAWVEGERRFVEEQYEEIISAPDAWLIADDTHTEDEKHLSSDLKATNSAWRIKGLVEQVTEHYAPLPSYDQMTRFLITVQLPILEQYHGRIASSLTAFETLSSAFIKAVPGALSVALGGQSESSVKVESGRLTGGIDGLSRLCKAHLSTRYIQNAMSAWGEELFFIELWTEINHRANLRARAQALSTLPNPIPNEADIPQDTIFEELVTQYSSLTRRAEEMIIQHVCSEVETVLKLHFNASHSLTEGDDDIHLSPTLLRPIAMLSSHLKFIRTHLPEVTSVGLYRRIAGRLSEHIFHRRILYRGLVTSREGREIVAESELWAETCCAAIGGTRSRAEVPWRTLLQASRLVGCTDVDPVLLRPTTPDEEWERMIVHVTGLNEMTKEEVMRVIRLRADSS